MAANKGLADHGYYASERAILPAHPEVESATPVLPHRACAAWLWRSPVGHVATLAVHFSALLTWSVLAMLYLIIVGLSGSVGMLFWSAVVVHAIIAVLLLRTIRQDG